MSILGLLLLALNIYSLIILGRVLLSWVPNVDYRNPLVKLLIDITEPVLRPVREMLPRNTGLDLSPMVVMLGLYVLSMLLRGIF
jgi:YggT family protein